MLLLPASGSPSSLQGPLVSLYDSHGSLHLYDRPHRDLDCDYPYGRGKRLVADHSGSRDVRLFRGLRHTASACRLFV